MKRILKLVMALAAAASLRVNATAQTANSFRYFYDDSGELSRVVDSTGIVIEYIYDPVGNILQVKRSVLADPNGLQLFNVIPARTGVGTTITIQG